MKKDNSVLRISLLKGLFIMLTKNFAIGNTYSYSTGYTLIMVETNVAVEDDRWCDYRNGFSQEDVQEVMHLLEDNKTIPYDYNSTNKVIRNLSELALKLEARGVSIQHVYKVRMEDVKFSK